jgi:hypothetical protein
MHKTRDKQYVIEHVARGQWSALEREKQIKYWAENRCLLERLEDPGRNRDLLWARLFLNDQANMRTVADGRTTPVTELEPTDGSFIGKRILRDGSVQPYPKTKYWNQTTALVPASIGHVYEYLYEARERNICLIRGARLYAGKERRDYKTGKLLRRNVNFEDTPTKLLFIDIDGVPVSWLADPRGAVREVVARLGEPWTARRLPGSSQRRTVSSSMEEAVARQAQRRGPLRLRTASGESFPRSTQ